LAAGFRAPTILRATALILFSSAVMTQSTDTNSPPATGPAAQSDSTPKGDVDMTEHKMSKKKSLSRKKMKKSHAKM
jgi:hypothetical protein